MLKRFLHVPNGSLNYRHQRQPWIGICVQTVARDFFFSVVDGTDWCVAFFFFSATGKAGQQLNKAVSELKSSGDAGDTIEKVEKTVKDLTSQANKLSADYDLPAKAKQALGVAGELADTAIVKVNEIL